MFAVYFCLFTVLGCCKKKLLYLFILHVFYPSSKYILTKCFLTNQHDPACTIPHSLFRLTYLFFIFLLLIFLTCLFISFEYFKGGLAAKFLFKIHYMPYLWHSCASAHCSDLGCCLCFFLLKSDLSSSQIQLHLSSVEQYKSLLHNKWLS